MNLTGMQQKRCEAFGLQAKTPKPSLLYDLQQFNLSASVPPSVNEDNPTYFIGFGGEIRVNMGKALRMVTCTQQVLNKCWCSLLVKSRGSQIRYPGVGIQGLLLRTLGFSISKMAGTSLLQRAAMSTQALWKAQFCSQQSVTALKLGVIHTLP